MQHNEYASIVEVDGWDSFYDKHDKIVKNKDFIFRGHLNSEWDLTTSLDRFADHIDKAERPKLETFFLEEFQRRYHNYSLRPPKNENLIEWWALMQHYGTPTRLLDWTYSYYVAGFFALEDLDNSKYSAIWAIDIDWVWKKLVKREKALLTTLKEDAHMIYEKNFKKFDGKSRILRLSPYLLHERLSVQQGCFLIPGNTNKLFVHNLIEFSESKDELKKHLFKFEITKDKKTRREILQDLYRMNISRASLFPGLDGFASSLKTIPYALPNLLNKKQKLWG